MTPGAFRLYDAIEIIETTEAIKATVICLGSINFNFGISHGLFSTSQAYETAPMLHEKFIYLNYVKNKNELSVGLVHEAIWGGSTKEYGKFPNSFKDFFKIFISSDGPFVEGSDHANALGNHLGIWDFYYKKNCRYIRFNIFHVYYVFLLFL